MIKLYGVTASRAARCLWMLGELGREFEQVNVTFRDGGIKAPEYLAINPNARIPTLVDGDMVLWESMAINLYLADKYDGGLKPKTPEDRARAVQWSFWGMLEMESGLFAVLNNRVLGAEEKRDVAKAEEAEEALQRPLKVLNGALKGREYLLGGSFSVADLNVAGILSWGKRARIGLEPHPKVKTWLNACLGRPAYKKLYAKE